jgi:hypothetical protein
MFSASIALSSVHEQDRVIPTALLKGMSGEVRRFDSVDLLLSVAALQLLPENISRTIRLEALAHAIVSQAPSGQQLKQASVEELQELCSRNPVADFEVTKYEDPPETHFVEPLLWRNSGYLVFPGIADDASFVLLHLARAMDVLPEFFPNHRFLAESGATLTALLRIGNELAKGASLRRWTEPQPAPAGGVSVPSDDRLRQLKAVVSFTHERMAELLASCGGLESIEGLITDFGTAVASSEIRGGSLVARPIVRHERQFIVALPGALLDAARTHVISRALEAGVAEELGHRFLRTGWTTAKEALLRLDHQLLNESSGQLGSSLLSRAGLFQFDSDKVAPVVMVSDPLVEHEVGQPFGRWELGRAQHWIDDRFSQTERRLKASSRPPIGIFSLLVVHGAGYEYLVGEPDSGSGTSLALRCAELDWISLLDGGEALALWKYISARRKARSRSEVMVFSQLDEFELYRSHRRTYYISDDTPPDGLSIEPGTGLSLRTAVARKYDPHPAMRENGSMTRVGSLRGEGVPIYADIGRLGRQPALLVEGPPTDVWILGPVQNDGGKRFDFPLVAQIVDGLAYWVWQFTPALTLIFEELGWSRGRLAIHMISPQLGTPFRKKSLFLSRRTSKTER